ncbi:hypothetical protein QQP08_018954 [Theobroma cacao]|nr:hypothetical protein QQP08_018954 [Theobroma cacao]
MLKLSVATNMLFRSNTGRCRFPNTQKDLEVSSYPLSKIYLLFRCKWDIQMGCKLQMIRRLHRHRTDFAVLPNQQSSPGLFPSAPTVEFPLKK